MIVCLDTIFSHIYTQNFQKERLCLYLFVRLYLSMCLYLSVCTCLSVCLSVIIHFFCVPATGTGTGHRPAPAPATGTGTGNRRRQPAPAPATGRQPAPAPATGTGTGNKPAPATGHSVPEQRTGNRQQGSGKCQLALSNRTRLPSSDHTFGLSCDRKSKRICTIKTQQRYRKDKNRYPKKDR